MPGPLKSAELARKAQERLPRIAILFTSGYTENSIVHGGRLDAGVQLLSKPYKREALARRVRHLLNNEKKVALSTEKSGNIDDDHRDDIDDTSRGEDVSRRVLLVEDSALIRTSDADMLAVLGYEAALDAVLL